MHAELLPVAPAARKRFSSTTTSCTPRSVRWKATLAPVTPPPTMTTSAVSTMRLPTLLVVGRGRWPATPQRAVVDHEGDGNRQGDHGLHEGRPAFGGEPVTELERGVEQEEGDGRADEDAMRRDQAHLDAEHGLDRVATHRHE